MNNIRTELTTDLMIDFETFGVNGASCPIVNLSVKAFDWSRFCDKPYSFKELVDSTSTFKLDVREQVKDHGRIVEKGTLDFWQNQEASVRKQVLPLKDDLKLAEFCNKFGELLIDTGKIGFWWSRNNAFDPPILRNAFYKAGDPTLLERYLKYYRVRDTITYIDAKFNFEEDTGFIPVSDEVYWGKTFKKHDSAHDVAADIMRLQTIARAEKDLGMVSK